MGIFNDFKKLLFGAKAVSKSAADKTIEKGKAAGTKLMDESEELWDKTKDVAEDVGEKIVEKTGDIWDKTKDTAEDVGEKIAEKTGDIWDKTKDTAEDVGEKLADKSSEVWEKALDSTEGVRTKIKEETSEFLEDAKDVAEDVGGKILKGAGALYDKARDVVEDVGEKIHEKGEDLFAGDKKDGDVTDIDLEGESNVDDLFEESSDSPEELSISSDEGIVEPDQNQDNSSPLDSSDAPKNEIIDKAKEAMNKMSGKLDETIEKAQSMSDRGEETYASDTTPAEALKKDPLVNDDFFAKAAAFADGDYEKVRDPFAPSKPEIVGKSESKKKDSDGTVPGFEDLDGDGNEIIDDALVIGEEE